MTPDVRLRIEELVLDGFAPGDRYRIGEAVERELTRLLAERGLPPALAGRGDVPQLDGGAFDLTPATGAEATGNQVARVVYEGMNR